jgi:hypothetical protein
METDILSSKALKKFIRGSMTLIGLFFFLSCSVAVLLFPFDKRLEIGRNAKITEASKTSKSSETEKDNEVTRYSEANEYSNIVDTTKNGDDDKSDNSDNEKPDENRIIVLILVLLSPQVVLLMFLQILFLNISCLTRKLNGSSKAKHEVKNEEPFIDKHIIETISSTCTTLANAIKPKSEKDLNTVKELLGDTLDKFLKLKPENKQETMPEAKKETKKLFGIFGERKDG